MKVPGKYLLPTIAIVGGLVAAWVMQPSARATTPNYAASPAAASVDSTHSSTGVHAGAAAENAGDRLSGTVIETIGVPNYTYLRIGEATANGQRVSGDLWAAVPAAKVEVGQKVTIVGAQRMDKFSSATLKRTFDLIYFGAIEGAGAETGALPPGHPPVGSEGVGALPPGHPAMGAGVAKDPAATGALNGLSQDVSGSDAPNPHTAPIATSEAISIGKVERASGKLGHTVAELVNGRLGLAGQKVRVRGVVVKSTPGVMGKTFVHVRDGSGNERTSDHDLTVTTEEVPRVGAQLLLEGTVVVDKDFGAGYSYRVLLENAHTVNE